MSDYELHQGDCLEVMRGMEACSVDSIVTDPPAGIGFMATGKDHWDSDKGGRKQWISWMTDVARECLRVIKPGGHALVWAIPRTSHWTGTAWEDAGWEPRDKIYHCFGSGFSKGLNISKALDKMAGAEREVVGPNRYAGRRTEGSGPDNGDNCYGQFGVPTHETAPSTEAAKRYDGFFSNLKPSIEEWWLFRKPVEGTIAENVLRHGTGGLNVGACRVETEDDTSRPFGSGGDHISQLNVIPRGTITGGHPAGRYPANLILDGSPSVVALFPVTKSGAIDPEKHIHKNGKGSSLSGSKDGSLNNYLPHQVYSTNSGSAARFFKACPFDEEDFEVQRLVYFSKASKRDRDSGCEGLEQVMAMRYSEKAQGPLPQQTPSKPVLQRNHHATVKSTPLMTYLCKLITPPNGIILDPFMGSGSTGKGAMLEGFNFIGIELDETYFEIAKARIEAAKQYEEAKGK